MSDTKYAVRQHETGKLYGGREWLGGRCLPIWLGGVDMAEAETWPTMTAALAAVLLNHADIVPWDVDVIAVNRCQVCDRICLYPTAIYGTKSTIYCGETCWEEHLDHLRSVYEEMEPVERKGRL